MSYQKLVRDLIPQIIEKSGSKPITHVLDDKEYLPELIKKLKEEILEFEADNSVEELADIQEVVFALSDALGISKEELESVRAEKARKRGAFKAKIYLEGVQNQ